MTNQNLLTMFHGQPWAISRAGWLGILGAMRSTAVVARAEQSPRNQFVRPTTGKKGRRIGVMSVSGTMVKGVPDEICELLGLANIDNVHRAADEAEASGLDTLIVHLDSPGGMVLGTEEAHERLNQLRAGGMQLIAYTDTMACSAAYWLAAACDEIAASPTAYVGSIGCLCQVADYSKMLEKAGVDVHYFVTEGSEAKIYGACEIPLSDEAKTAFQDSVNRIGARFKAHVAAGRPNLAMTDMNGGAWQAQDAPNGYVDHIGIKGKSGKPTHFATIDSLVEFVAGL